MCVPVRWLAVVCVLRLVSLCPFTPPPSPCNLCSLDACSQCHPRIRCSCVHYSFNSHQFLWSCFLCTSG
ncbi:hypothetical protein BCR44DRAFT_1436785 [Catenaria anguillulae PL171]|uniref:Secreted protein n=1 Tax=Catenaria anguillulae PL171 TaxID=765915 RepID=A0A1Y2HHX2_9FUNG|nr:hypothetical protein BCR44DRAFT_1436785 [Catenaria anguillulae PL171]